MKVPVLCKTLRRLLMPLGRHAVCSLITVLFLWTKSTPLQAEGSKDFVNYPGVRMFLDTRDPQQLKVYARAGETINVGSSHVGIQGGFIVVINPFGDTMAVFDNTGATTGLAIINNNIQEGNGPIGAPNGYNPGTVGVSANNEGIWTVIFDYPSYVQTPFVNIANNAPWTRAANQPNTRRVVLAWDITVTSGGAGNAGGTPHEGRVYSNEHISLINGNGQSTSPVFYVLTDDGYLYQVNMLMADPFRFPISSNSLGITTGDGTPTYKSKNEVDFSRDDDPNTWDPSLFYLYEPQAEDFNELINNKIFFNLPDGTMPLSSTTTDVFRNNTHETWLFNELQTLDILNQFILGANPNGPPCAPGIIEFGKGAYFVFETNLGGSVMLQIDINNDGDYTDSVDVTIMGTIGNGIDSIFWDGLDGFGNPIAVQDSFTFNYTGTVRFGELHIALTDVENNAGGVTFNWLNAPPGFPSDQFYYDHSEILGPVSGGGTPGNALPTNIPYTYGSNAGNNRYIDQWFFIEQDLDTIDVVLNVVIECDCINNSPDLVALPSSDTICAGDDLNLGAANIFPGVGDLTYNWSGPNGFTFTQTIGEGDTSNVTIPGAPLASAGTYTVIAANSSGCADTVEVSVVVNPTPQVLALNGGGTFCAGEVVTFTAINLTPGISTLTYTLTGPDTTATGLVVGNTVTVVLGPLTEAGEGTYSLVVVSENGCASDPVTADVVVNTTPVLVEVSGGGAYCEGDNVSLIVDNLAPGIGTMTCTVTGPNGFFSQTSVNGDSLLVINLTNISTALEGNYNFTCTFGTCVSDVLTVSVDVELTPEINGESPNGDFCVGADVNFTAENVVANTGPLTYHWIGPNGDTLFTGTNAPELGPFPYTLQNVQPSDAGIYTLILVTSAGCQSVPQTVEIGVLPTPEICMLSGGGDACVGQTVTLSGFNCSSNVGLISYTWLDPQGNEISSGSSASSGPFEAVLNNVQLSDSGTYTLILTSDNNPDPDCSDSQTVELNVLQGLNVIDITPDSSYCEGTNVTLTATTTVSSGEIIYTWTGPNGFVFSDTVSAPGPLSVIVTSISVTDTGTYTLTVVSDAGCEAGPFDVFVGLHPTFNITSITGGGSYCLENADSIILTGTGTGSADSVLCFWIGPDGDTLATDTILTTDPLSLDVTGQAQGNYTLICITAEGCSDSESATVSIIDNPIANILVNDTSLCELDTFLLCGQNLNPDVGVFDYTWTTPSGILITGQGSGTDVFCDELLPISTFGSGLYTLVISYQGCISVDSVNISLNPNPVISQIDGGGTYCVGDTVILTVWNINPAVDSFFITCNIVDTTITGVGFGTDPITIIMTESGFVCCSIESFDGCVSSLVCAEVIFEPAPDIEITSNSPVCENDTLQLNGTNNAACTGDVTYTWTGPGGFTFSSTAPCTGPFPATLANPEPGEYCLIVDNGNCADTACINVEVVEIPFVEGGLVSGGGSYCAGDDVALTATIVNPSGGDIDYVWTLNGDPVSSGTAASGTTVTLDLPNIDPAAAGEYCIELTCVTTGCQSEGPDCASVTVSESVQNLTATGGGDYCEGDDVLLNGSSDQGPGDVTYTWTGPGGFSFTGTASNGGPYPATVSSVTVNQSGDYVLVVETDEGCLDSAFVTVNVNPKPLITEVSGGGDYCEGETATLSFTIDPNGANSVDWTLSCPDGDTSGTVTTVTTITVDILVSGATAGTCTITAVSDEGCEADEASQSITVTEVDSPVLAVSQAVLCPGDVLTLTTTAQNGDVVTYEWFKDDVSIGVTTDPTFVVNPGMAGEYTVLVTVDDCASGTSAPVTVTAVSAPDAVDDTATTDQDTPVSGNVITNDSPQTGVTVTVVSGPANGTVDLDENGNFTYTPGNAFSGTDMFTYELCLNDCPEACDEATVTITIIKTECEFPNVITPNGDGINDVFNIQCEPPATSRLRVFNRWGDEIVSFQPYQNDWDGTYGSDKKEVPASTYFFLFEEDFNTGDEPKAGYIKVVR